MYVRAGRPGIVLAALLLTTTAHAQSSVTLFGMLDVGLSFISNAGGSKEVQASDSVFTPSLVGLRGLEELGDGYATVFELESQFSVDSGAGVPGPAPDFNREAYIGIRKAEIGTISIGQQYNLMADFLFYPPGHFDASFLYGGLYNMRQGPFEALGIPNNPTGDMDLDQIAGTSRVSNSVKFTSAAFDGFTFGALYGFGNGVSFSKNNTIGFGANFAVGRFGVGAAFNQTRYPTLGSGGDGIRNLGVGLHDSVGDFYLSGLYTNTRNTLSGATVQAVQIGGLYSVDASMRVGANYQYWHGNAILQHNLAQQVTGVVQYSLSQRTLVYAEAAWQWTGGDVAGAHDAWINGVAPSSTTHQAVARLGMQTVF